VEGASGANRDPGGETNHIWRNKKGGESDHCLEYESDEACNTILHAEARYQTAVIFYPALVLHRVSNLSSRQLS
jgi:hypothetical protein